MPRGWLAAVAVSAASGLVGSAAAAPPAPRLLGMVGQTAPLRLVRVDPGTLRPLPGKTIAVGSGGCASREGGVACWTVPAWSFSPDRALLAVARDGRSLRLVDVTRMRVAADLRLGGGAIGGLAWLARRSVLALEETGYERQRLLAVDLTTGHVAARRALGGSVVRLARTPRELVLLVAPANAIGSARLAVADPRGAVRFVRLGRILAGSKLLAGPSHGVEQRLPGLAVDPQGRRAFVVDQGVVAAVDLRSLAVSYRELEQASSSRLLDRFPAARSKVLRGYSRWAQWLGAGVLAVSGTDEGERAGMRPAGLLLVDSGGWSVRIVDPGATSFVVAGDVLLATGWSRDATGEETAIGLAAYGFDGGRRFQLFDGEDAWVAQVYDDLAYVGVSRPGEGQKPLQIVDLAAGRVVGQRPQPLPWLLLDAASSWWG